MTYSALNLVLNRMELPSDLMMGSLQLQRRGPLVHWENVISVHHAELVVIELGFQIVIFDNCVSKGQSGLVPS